MDPLTIALLLGGGWLLLKGRAPAAPVLVAPAAPATMATPSSAIIQYQGAVAPPRGIDASASASPVEQSGFIPPYQATAGSSAVALGGMGACGCSSCQLGDVRSDRSAIHSQLAALRAQYFPQIRAAAQAQNAALVHSLTQALHARLKAILESYHSAHPNERPEISRVAKSVAPVFMGRRRDRGQISTNV